MYKKALVFLYKNFPKVKEVFMEQTTTLYQFIKEKCKERGTTITRMCKDIKISTCLPTAWKNGTLPNEATLIKIAQHLSVPIDELTNLRDVCKRVTYESSDSTRKRREPAFIKVPVFGTIAAGKPMSAIENNLGYMYYPFAMAESAELFGLKVKGDSMEPRIMSGDVVILKKQSTVDSGQIAAVLIENEEATLKKINRSSKGITLIPLNPSYEPMFYSNEQIESLPVTIIGCAIGITRQL